MLAVRLPDVCLPTVRAATLCACGDGRDLVDVGAYQPGSNRLLDLALERMPLIDTFLRQDTDDPTALAESVEMLSLIVELDEAVTS